MYQYLCWICRIKSCVNVFALNKSLDSIGFCILNTDFGKLLLKLNSVIQRGLFVCLYIFGVLHPDNIWGHISSLWLYSAASLGDQWPICPTRWHYPATELTNSSSIIVMSSAGLGSHTYQLLCKSMIYLNRDWTLRPSAWEACTVSIRPPSPVIHRGKSHYSRQGFDWLRF